METVQDVLAYIEREVEVLIATAGGNIAAYKETGKKNHNYLQWAHDQAVAADTLRRTCQYIRENMV